MGNTLGAKKTAKIMKIDGETFKLKTPVQAGEVVKNHPGLVLLDSREVKQLGLRAKPLEPYRSLEPKRLYFLVDLPKKAQNDNMMNYNKNPRRVQSGINMTAKDRLESLMLSRRSVSDLAFVRPSNAAAPEFKNISTMRVKMRLPKAEVERVMRESRGEAETAAKIVELYKAHAAAEAAAAAGKQKRVSFMPINGENQVAMVS